MSDICYRNSRYMTRELVHPIVNQHQSEPDTFDDHPTRDKIRAKKVRREEEKVKYVQSTLNPAKRKIFEEITETEASGWVISKVRQNIHNFFTHGITSKSSQNSYDSDNEIIKC